MPDVRGGKFPPSFGGRRRSDGAAPNRSSRPRPTPRRPPPPRSSAFTLQRFQGARTDKRAPRPRAFAEGLAEADAQSADTAATPIGARATDSAPTTTARARRITIIITHYTTQHLLLLLALVGVRIFPLHAHGHGHGLFKLLHEHAAERRHTMENI